MNRENDIVQAFVSLLNDSGVKFTVFEQNYVIGSAVVIQFRFSRVYEEYAIFYDDHVAFDNNQPTRYRIKVEYYDPMLAHYFRQCVDSDSFRLMLLKENIKRVEHESRG